jgi:DnaJ like chaperone protein
VQLKGKLIGGIAGLVFGDLVGLPLGGLTGFIAGSLIGHYLFDRPVDREAAEASDYQVYQRRQGMFVYHVIALGAKMAKSDGPVNRSEINFVEQLMRRQFHLSDKGRAHSIRIWAQVKDSSDSFDQYARAFFRDFGKERHQVLNMMDLLFAMAAADGGMHPREEELLLRAAGIFHISRMQYERLRTRYYAPPPSAQPHWSPLDPYYAILGAQPGESMDAIKQKFRTLAMKWHPDRATARGASPEALRHAKEKFQQINDAYERIVAAKEG